jgi:hypothetical protein
MRSRPILLAALAVAVTLPVLGRAGESPTEAKLRDALRASTAQLRTAEDERAKAQASEAALQKKVQALEAQLAAALAAAKEAPRPRGNPRAEAELRSQLASKAEANQRLGELLSRCEAGAREQSEVSQAREKERAELASQVGPLGQLLTTCAAKNAILYRTAREILDRYANVGLGDVLSAKEPFIGAKRVQLQNLAQDYQDKLADQRVMP